MNRLAQPGRHGEDQTLALYRTTSRDSLALSQHRLLDLPGAGHIVGDRLRSTNDLVQADPLSQDVLHDHQISNKSHSIAPIADAVLCGSGSLSRFNHLLLYELRATFYDLVGAIWLISLDRLKIGFRSVGTHEARAFLRFYCSSSNLRRCDESARDIPDEKQKLSSSPLKYVNERYTAIFTNPNPVLGASKKNFTGLDQMNEILTLSDAERIC